MDFTFYQINKAVDFTKITYFSQYALSTDLK